MGDKQQTTRKLTDRIKVGDICHIYIEQRNKIIGKPLRRLTRSGLASRPDRENNERTSCPNHDYAHFLGKVIITEVYDHVPNCNSTLCAWAKADGFDDFAAADTWFTQQYGDDWMQRPWTVIRWGGWTERYFEATR